jgi:uncharacterized protein YjbI with pentapeptide repeats
MSKHEDLNVTEWLHRLRSSNRATRLRLIETARHKGWLTDGSLQGIDLNGIDLQKADLRNADLSHRILDEAKLMETDLRGARLRQASMTKVKLDLANLDEADLTEAQLEYAHFLDASLVRTRFTRANLHRAWINGPIAKYADFQGANLTSAQLIQIDFTSANFQDANLDSVSAFGVMLNDAVVDWTQLSHAHELRWTIMPSGKLYDGRLDLPGDMKWLSEHPECDLNDEIQIAEAYYVSLEEYRQGQKWRQENLPQPPDDGAS